MTRYQTFPNQYGSFDVRVYAAESLNSTRRTWYNIGWAEEIDRKHADALATHLNGLEETEGRELGAREAEGVARAFSVPAHA